MLNGTHRSVEPLTMSENLWPAWPERRRKSVMLPGQLLLAAPSTPASAILTKSAAGAPRNLTQWLQSTAKTSPPQSFPVTPGVSSKADSAQL